MSPRTSRSHRLLRIAQPHEKLQATADEPRRSSSLSVQSCRDSHAAPASHATSTGAPAAKARSGLRFWPLTSIAARRTARSNGLRPVRAAPRQGDVQPPAGAWRAEPDPLHRLDVGRRRQVERHGVTPSTGHEPPPPTAAGVGEIERASGGRFVGSATHPRREPGGQDPNVGVLWLVEGGSQQSPTKMGKPHDPASSERLGDCKGCAGFHVDPSRFRRCGRRRRLSIAFQPAAQLATALAGTTRWPILPPPRPLRPRL